MYSPKIYESQIPCLYHAAQSLGVPMTQLVNAFVYHGLTSAHYNSTVFEMLPSPNQVLPEGIPPKMQMFSPHYDSLRDMLRELPPPGTLNIHFQPIGARERIEALEECVSKSSRRENDPVLT